MRWIYTLLLSNNKYYVGFTENLTQRMEQHFKSEGAKWTQLHKPVKIIEVVEETNDWQEDFTTLVMMRKHGIENVRGGMWCSVYPLKQIPQHYNDIDPLRTLEENLIILGKDTCKVNLKPTDNCVLNLFKEGKNDFQISQLTGMTCLDVEIRIADLIKKGELKHLDIGLTQSKIDQLKRVVDRIGRGSKTVLSIKSLCDRYISVTDIRYYLLLF